MTKKRKARVNVITSVEITGGGVPEVILKMGLGDLELDNIRDFYNNKGIPFDENEKAIFIRYDLLKEVP